MTIRSHIRNAMIITASGVAVFLAILAFQQVLRLSGNFHTVVPDQFYRSSQLSPTALEGYVQRYGVKTIINLRGAEPNKKWYRDEKQVADASGTTSAAIPPSIANANAQMTAADAPPDSAKGMSAAMSEKANTVLQAAADKPADAEAPAEAGVVASDQLNSFDRSLSPSEQPVALPSQTVVLASTSRPSSETANDSSTLDKTSLIGKIFIAFGALLTMASAARMFMA